MRINKHKCVESRYTMQPKRILIKIKLSAKTKEFTLNSNIAIILIKERTHNKIYSSPCFKLLTHTMLCKMLTLTLISFPAFDAQICFHYYYLDIFDVIFSH